jgi:eukaryotic-like serine/threonine-protein kinase
MFFSNINRQTSSTTCSRGCSSCHECHVWRKLEDPSLPQAENLALETIAKSCSGCQQMLAQSQAAELPWWEDARSSWLESELPETVRSESSFVTIEVQAEPLSDGEVDVQRVPVNFLMPAAHPELLGKLGRYDVERVVGVGGMGVVLKAYDPELHRVVAIKVLAEHLATISSARKRFAREAQAAAAVVHPNVIPIFNVETDEKFPFLVMQCVSGGSLQAKVDAQGPVSIAEALRVVKQTASGLHAAHQQGLVHRDVKPANILLEENVDRVLLSDFGLARTVDDASFTRTGVVVGTPHYMSPEQANGDSVQHASDQFSLGSVIYFMLTGHPPFRAATAMGVLNRICHSTARPLSEVNASVPLEVAQLVDRLMAKDPKQRFASAEQVELEADRLLSALQSGKLRIVTAKPARLMRWINRKDVIARLTAAIVLMAVAFLWNKNPQIDKHSSTPPVGTLDAIGKLGEATPSTPSQQTRGAISHREYEAIRNQVWAEASEFNAVNSELQQALQQAHALEQQWQQNGNYWSDEMQFHAELERMKSQIQRTGNQWNDDVR